MTPAWRMASLAAPVWSSGTWCVEKREGGSALDNGGQTLVNDTAKDTVARATLPPPEPMSQALMQPEQSCQQTLYCSSFASVAPHRRRQGDQ